MKSASGILAYISLLLNMAYLSLWIGVFKAYEGRPFEEVKVKFESFMPFSHGWTVFLLILLSVFSLIILARKPAVTPKIRAVLQSFLCLYIFGSFYRMKNIVIICTVLLALGTGCSKEKIANKDTEEFAFRVKKNGENWKVNGAQGYLNSGDSTFYVLASGENNELITFNFKRNPLSTGRLEEFGAGATISSCELCAAIAASYSLDPAKDNRFEILGFDNLESRVLGRFSVNLKKDRLYEGEFTEESNVYEGTFSVVYKKNAW